MSWQDFSWDISILLRREIRRPKVLGDGGELLEGGAQILDDAGGQHVGRGQRIGALQAFVAQPEEIEADLVALEQVVVVEDAESFALLAGVAILGGIAGDEVIQVRRGSAGWS